MGRVEENTACDCARSPPLITSRRVCRGLDQHRRRNRDACGEGP